MTKHAKTSLVTNTLLLIVIPVAALFAIYLIVGYQQSFQSTKERYMDKIGLLTFKCATQINNELYGISELLHNTVETLELENDKTLDDVRESLVNALTSNQYVYGIGIALNNDYYHKGEEEIFLYEHKPVDSLSTNIKEIIIDKSNYNSYPYHNKEWWSYSATIFEPNWTLPYYDKGLGNVLMITYTIPVFIDGRFAGVAGIDVNIKALKNIVTKASIRSKVIFERTQIFILSKDSTIVFDKKIKFVGKKLKNFENENSLEDLIEKLYASFNSFFGVTEFKYKGVTYIISHSPIPQTQWVVTSILKRKQIDEAIFNSILPKIFVSVFFILLLVVIVFILSKKIAKPINELCDASIRVAKGDYNVIINSGNRNDELRVLADNFRIMKENLKKREQHLIESSNNIKQLLDNIPLAVFQFDNKHKLVYYNQIGKDVLKLNEDNHILQDFSDWIPLMKNPEDREVVNNAFNGETVIIEGDNIFSEIKESKTWFNNRYVQIHIIPYLKENEVDSITVIILDLTAVKQAENLRVEKKSAELANKTKGEFLARMSHEIRTPLNAVIGFSDLALTKYTADDQFNEYFKKINAAARHLLVIVNDILDYSKIEAGKIELEEIPFDVDLLLMDITDLTMNRAHKKNIEFIISHSPLIPVPLIGDPYKLKQILVNLVGNAIKFTDHGELHVNVDLKLQKNNSVTLLFSVKDTGIGMPEDQIHKLFQPFMQGDGSITRRFGGTGIGLAISKRLVELMNGKIWVESKEGEGTTFFFTAEFKVEKRVSNIQEYIKKFQFKDDIRGLNVLVCDDNKTTCMLLDTMLTSLSFKVKAVGSGNEVIKLLEAGNKFDLLIIDRIMPSPDGVETMEILKSRGLRKNIKKVIMLSAYDKVLNDEELESLFVDLFLKKPFNYSNMFDAIMTVFGKVDKSTLKNKEKRKRNALFVEIPDKEVLIVDDNELNRDLAGDMLTTMGLRVDFAENGQEAVDKILDPKNIDRYAIVFMDLQMPVTDGFEATRNIRKNKKYSALPIVAMSADVLPGVRKRCLDAGMNDFVAKPVDPLKVVDVITKWVKNIKIIKKEDSGKTKEISKDLTGLKHINVAEGLQRIGNNEENYINLLVKFYNNFLDFTEKWKNIESLEEKQKLIHGFKGVAGNIGANKLFSFVVKFEKQLKENSINDELFLKVILEFENVLAEIAPLANIRKKAVLKKAVSEENREYLIESLKKVAAMLREGDPDAQKEIEVLAPYFTNDITFIEVIKLVNAYRFEEAASKIEQVRI